MIQLLFLVVVLSQTTTSKLSASSAFDASGKVDDKTYKKGLIKLAKHAELLHWSPREKLLQFELHLPDKVERIYDVLPPDEKLTFNLASVALGSE